MLSSHGDNLRQALAQRSRAAAASARKPVPIEIALESTTAIGTSGTTSLAAMAVA